MFNGLGTKTSCKDDVLARFRFFTLGQVSETATTTAMKYLIVSHHVSSPGGCFSCNSFCLSYLHLNKELINKRFVYERCVLT